MAFKELLQVGNSYNMPVKTYWCDSEAEIANLPTNIPAGSVCELLTNDGLKIYMLRKTGESEGTWVLI